MSDSKRRKTPPPTPEPARGGRVVGEAANLWTTAADEPVTTPVTPVSESPGVPPSQDGDHTPSDERPAEYEPKARASKPVVSDESDDEDEDEGEKEPFVYKPITPEDFGPGEEWARDMFFIMKHAAKHGLPPFDFAKRIKKPKPAKRTNVWDD